MNRVPGPEDGLMMRKTIRTMVMALVAVFAISGISEAAAKHVVRHHVRHTTRVARHGATVVRKAVKRTAHAAHRTTRHVVRKASTKPR